MEIFRVTRPENFDEAPEAAVDTHFGILGDKVFIIVGGRVAIPSEESRSEPTDLNWPWKQQGLTADQRNGAFEEWLSELRPAPDNVAPVSPSGLGAEVMVWPSERAGFYADVTAFIVRPLAPLPRPPAAPSSIYGHLPFSTMTEPSTLIYRWEAFPTSRRILRTRAGGEILPGTYAAPASEVPFAPTGFAAVARFALPNLMPAMYRWELQPVAGTFIECGASVPLYGQSGGGVEVRFPRRTHNRCPIADPAQLPAL